MYILNEEKSLDRMDRMNRMKQDSEANFFIL